MERVQSIFLKRQASCKGGPDEITSGLRNEERHENEA